MDLKEIEKQEAALRAQFSTASLSPGSLKSLNKIPHQLPTALAFLLIPINAKGAFLPGYGAVMGFPNSEPCLFPFTGPYLWEAAAHLAETLFVGEPLGRLEAGSRAEDILYLGVWEFWRRVHESATRTLKVWRSPFLRPLIWRSPRIPTTPRGYPSEFEMEARSIPYRFGQFVFRAQGFRPLAFRDDDPADAVHRWQEDFCRWSGWPSPRGQRTQRRAFPY